MAQAKQDRELIGELVKSLSHADSSKTLLEQKSRSAVHSISTASLSRVSQFEVSTKVDGLVEKLRILNRDDAAEALSAQWRKLQSLGWEWTPELLTILLQLSDRPSVVAPVIDTDLTAADHSSESSGGSASDQSAADDASDIWSNVDFGAGDSDAFSEADSSETPEMGYDTYTTAADIPTAQSIPSMPKPSQIEELTALKTAYWNMNVSQAHESSGHSTLPALDLTELQVSREVIFMLLGLPSSIFAKSTSGSIYPSRDLSILQVSSSSIKNQMQDFAEIGTSILKVRTFTSRPQSSIVVQRLQYSLGVCVTQFDNDLNDKQSEILDVESDFTVSLLALSDTVRSAARGLLLVTKTLDRISNENAIEDAINILEDLYDGICAAQGSGDVSAYHYFTELFSACFHAYQRALRLWMEEGVLMEGPQILFIRKSERAVNLEDIWEQQFSFTEASARRPLIPSFIRRAAKSIFNTGKAVFFLRLLGNDVSSQRVCTSDLNDLNLTPAAEILTPFEESFDSTFSCWVAERYHTAARVLRQHLEQDCGLHKSLDALQEIYLCKDSILAQRLLTPIFEKLEHDQRRDPALMTDNARAVFASSGSIESSKLAVRLHEPDRNRPKNSRSMEALAMITIEYSLAWPVANIIRSKSMAAYQGSFILLSQLHRAKYLLQRHKLPGRDLHANHAVIVNSIYQLRLRLLAFTNAVLRHLLATSHDIAVPSMRRRLASVVDLDGMVMVHQEYVEELEHISFLKSENSSLKRAIVSILDLTIIFADMLSSLAPEGSKSNANPRGRRDGESSSSSDSEDNNAAVPRPAGLTPLINESNLKSKILKLNSTFTQLHGFVLASVRGLAKSDGSIYWELLASSLTTLEHDHEP